VDGATEGPEVRAVDGVTEGPGVRAVDGATEGAVGAVIGEKIG